VVRVLSKSASELAQTDMPDHVLSTLAVAPIEYVHLLGRRGPVQATFTTKELRELGELEEAGIQIDSADLILDAVSASELAENKVATRNLKVLQEWCERPARPDAQRTIEVTFFRRPVAIHGTDHVTGLDVERTYLNREGQLTGTGEVEELPVDLIVRSVGYRGTAMPGVPFDPDRNVIPNRDGRVMEGDHVIPGLYVAGWIKRGPTGIIGTNKKCAVGTVASLIADFEEGILAPQEDVTTIEDVLKARGVRFVDSSGWRSVDAQERARGESQGRPRVTIHDRDELIAIGAN
jgi:ferredoxin--NADP+ reductase